MVSEGTPVSSTSTPYSIRPIYIASVQFPIWFGCSSVGFARKCVRQQYFISKSLSPRFDISLNRSELFTVIRPTLNYQNTLSLTLTLLVPWCFTYSYQLCLHHSEAFGDRKFHLERCIFMSISLRKIFISSCFLRK